MSWSRGTAPAPALDARMRTGSSGSVGGAPTSPPLSPPPGSPPGSGSGSRPASPVPLAQASGLRRSATNLKDGAAAAVVAADATTRRASAPAPGSAPGTPHTAHDTEATEALMAKTAQDTLKVWHLPVEVMSIGPDVARLARELVFGVRNGRYLFVGDDKAAPGDNVVNLVVALTEAVESPLPAAVEQLQLVLAPVRKAKDDDELAERIRSLIGTPHLPLTSHVVNILRCLTLDMVAPAVALLRSTFFAKYPYGGVNGSNKTTIEIDLNNIITVVHARREKSRSDSPDERFYFTWNCTFRYDLMCTSIESEVNVVAVEFDEGVKMSMRRHIRALLEPFVGERNAYSVLWSRQLERLPVHKDIARLSKSLVITNASGAEVFREKEEEEVPGHISFRNIITVLAEGLGDERIMQAVNNRALFDQYIKQTGDLSEQILAFFGCGAFAEESPVVKVLKLVNQEMIYPAVMQLRNHLYTKFPYKDVKGGWQVHICMNPGAVMVTHVKREQSHDSRDEARFEFEWQLQLLFDHRMEYFTPQLYITDYTFSDKTLAEIKRVVLDQMLELMHPDSMYRRIWSKPVEHTPVHRDLIRFLRSGGLEIVNETGADLYRHNGSKDVSDVQSLRAVLLCLARHLDGDAMASALESSFSKFFVGGADAAEELLKLLMSGVVPPSSRTMRVLRCLHSDMVFPGYLKLRKAFYQPFPFRDVKNSWHVQIKLTDARSATVALSKRERTHSEQPQDYFEFCWVLMLTFNSDMSLFTSDLRIIDYAWSERTRDDIKATLRPLWAPFILPQTSYALLRRDDPVERTLLAPEDILRIVRKTLDRQPGVLHAEHEDLPASTDVRLLLSKLTEALRTVPNLPLVAIPLK